MRLTPSSWLFWIIRAHDGEELRFMIGVVDVGDTFDYFEARCLDLQEVF